MSKVKHTPGPWVTGYAEDGALSVWPVLWPQDVVKKGVYQMICKVAPAKNTTKEDMENAILIAAAPDMLEMLEEMVKEFSADENTLSESETIYKAVEVIRKAKGEKDK